MLGKRLLHSLPKTLTLTHNAQIEQLKTVHAWTASGCSTSRMIDSSGIILVVVRMAAPLAAR